MSVAFSVRSSGRCFEGRYTIEGRHIEVVTPYGARRTVLGLHRPVKLAKALYRVILRDVSHIATPSQIGIDDEAGTQGLAALS